MCTGNYLANTDKTLRVQSNRAFKWYKPGIQRTEKARPAIWSSVHSGAVSTTACMWKVNVKGFDQANHSADILVILSSGVKYVNPAPKSPWLDMLGRESLLLAALARSIHMADLLIRVDSEWPHTHTYLDRYFASPGAGERISTADVWCQLGTFSPHSGERGLPTLSTAQT